MGEKKGGLSYMSDMETSTLETCPTMQETTQRTLFCCAIYATGLLIGLKKHMDSHIQSLRTFNTVLLTVTCEPVVFIIHPAVEARLMQDSQFVNAATFGDRSVITGGHIVKYLGLDIVVVPKGSLAIDPPGTYGSLMMSRYAVHAALKRAPTMETQYLVQTQRKYLYASVRFGKAVVCNDGVLWVYTGA